SPRVVDTRNPFRRSLVAETSRREGTRTGSRWSPVTLVSPAALARDKARRNSVGKLDLHRRGVGDCLASEDPALREIVRVQYLVISQVYLAIQQHAHAGAAFAHPA